MRCANLKKLRAKGIDNRYDHRIREQNVVWTDADNWTILVVEVGVVKVPFPFTDKYDPV